MPRASRLLTLPEPESQANLIYLASLQPLLPEVSTALAGSSQQVLPVPILPSLSLLSLCECLCVCVCVRTHSGHASCVYDDMPTRRLPGSVTEFSVWLDWLASMSSPAYAALSLP